MNRTLVKRWLNEYLDGEIGLADKAELERLMAEDPELREEYKRMRQMGLLLGGQPEVQVHPSRFRARLADALDGERRVGFTPQRAFALAMIVALIVVGLSMSMLVYQQGVLGGTQLASQPKMPVVAASVDQGHSLVIDTGVGAERFFSRLLLSQQLGLVEASTVEPLLTQTRIYDGAVCNSQASDPLFNLKFRQTLGQPVTIKANAHVARSLGLLTQELSGRQPLMLVRSGETESMSLDKFCSLYGEDRKLTVVLLFSAQK